MEFCSDGPCECTGWAKKTAHGVCGNNFVNSQYFFIIFGTRTLWEICKWMVHSSTT